MKVSTAALPFLILAAALGLPTHASFRHRSPAPGLPVAVRDLDHPRIQNPDVRHTSDCCLSYAAQNVQCEFMEDYHETSSKCSQPAVIFITKRGQQVCADPHSRSVQHCMEDLDSAKKQRKRIG